MSDLHAKLAPEHFFSVPHRLAFGTKAQASGRAWALAINEHTSNRALWQYVHDAFAHVLEDILEHGPGDHNDDAILEKGNRRKKRLGDRCCFRGGTNRVGATYVQTLRVKEKVNGIATGRFITKKRSRIASLGQAAQVQTLDLIAQICESGRACRREMMSAREGVGDGA